MRDCCGGSQAQALACEGGTRVLLLQSVGALFTKVRKKRASFIVLGARLHGAVHAASVRDVDRLPTSTSTSTFALLTLSFASVVMTTCRFPVVPAGAAGLHQNYGVLLAAASLRRSALQPMTSCAACWTCSWRRSGTALGTAGASPSQNSPGGQNPRTTLVRARVVPEVRGCKRHLRHLCCRGVFGVVDLLRSY